MKFASEIEPIHRPLMYLKKHVLRSPFDAAKSPRETGKQKRTVASPRAACKENEREREV